jgi:hypothetical protein
VTDSFIANKLTEKLQRQFEKKQTKRFEKKYTNYVENQLALELEEEENKH